MTDISQEDKSTIDKFFDTLKGMAITGSEVSLNKIGECISKMPLGDLQNMGRLVKTYGYYGAFFAIKQSIEEHDLGPVGKYALGTGIVMLFIPAQVSIGTAALTSMAIGGLVGLSWDYVEENKEDLEAWVKDILSSVGINIKEDNSIETQLKAVSSQCSIPAKEETMCYLQTSTKIAEKQASPLVIDLDGDGIVETSSTDNGIYFDHDNNGFAENTGWVNSEDGVLVRDINGNGQIDNGSELFGNNTILSNGEKAANGFEALKDLDSNNDGVFNNQDTAWNEVKVWKDTNQNGIVDEGELLTLEQANISGINLNYDSVNFSDSNDNAHKQQGTFIKSDGTTGAVHDVWFDADYADTLDKSNLEIFNLVNSNDNQCLNYKIVI